MNTMTVYHLAYPSGVDVEPTRYGDLTSAALDALMWAAATGRHINIVDQRGQVVSFAEMY